MKTTIFVEVNKFRNSGIGTLIQKISCHHEKENTVRLFWVHIFHKSCWFYLLFLSGASFVLSFFRPKQFPILATQKF